MPSRMAQTIMHHQVSFAMLHRPSALSSGDKSMSYSGTCSTLSTLSADQKSARTAAGQRNMECNSRLGDTAVQNCALQVLQAVARPSERRAVVTNGKRYCELMCCREACSRCTAAAELARLSRRRCLAERCRDVRCGRRWWFEVSFELERVPHWRAGCALPIGFMID